MKRIIKFPTRFKKKTAQPESESHPSSHLTSTNKPTLAIPFPDGIKAWRDCQNASVDICFVHGLTGNRDSSWTADGETIPWPQSLLPSKLERARILTFGYDAYIVRKNVTSSNRLIDHATDLLNDLTTDRAINNASSRPLIFIAHSLGSLVCKEAILLSRNNPEAHLQSVFINTKAIVFMGTPHTGSWMAEWANIPASALGIIKSTNTSLLKILATDDQLLESLQIRFLSMLRDLRESNRRLEVTCFFEQLPSPIIGKVVPKESATLSGYNIISIHANHCDMVRFSSADNTGFKRVLGELIRWEAEIRMAPPLQAAPVNSTSKESGRQNTSTHRPRRIYAGQSDSIHNPNSETNINEAVKQAIDKASATITSKDDRILQASLLDLTHDERAQAAASKCIEALNLGEQVKQITHFTILSRNLRNMDLDPDILDRAIEKTEEARQKMKQEVKSAYKGAKFRCLKSLSFPEMGARQANIERPATNTCNWIYSHPTFLAWESQFNTLLWIKGKPGSGKSTLMKSLYQKRKEGGEQQKTVGDSKSIYLSFFFNARGTAVERTPIGLYITLLHGVLQYIPLAMCEFLPIFAAKEFHSQNGKIVWQTTEVADAFHSIIEQKQENYIEIAIDALDECEDEEVRLAVGKFESSINNAAAAGAKLRVCWSSRYYPHIGLKSKNGFELQLDKQNDLDIRQYVQGEFHTGIGSSIVSIKEDVISRANGVFLWAVLVTRKLLKAIDCGEDEKELRILLNSIPSKLDDLFDEIFKNANASTMKRQELVCMAQWIFCAFRPLTINEFLTATSFQVANISLSYHSIKLSRDARDRLKRRITDISGGLFEVTGSEGLSRVQVIHESVREFFLGPKGLSLLQASSQEAFVLLSHKELALVCFKSLLAEEFHPMISRPQDHRLESISDILKNFTTSWKPPDNSFLETYVQDFVFEHFDRARDIFGSESSASSPFEGLAVRRLALKNFLLLCCSQIKENKILRAGFSAHLQKVSVDPLAFGFQVDELTKLMAFLNNLSASSSLFSSKQIYMYEDFCPSGMAKAFIALFYACPRPGGWLHALAKSPQRLSLVRDLLRLEEDSKKKDKDFLTKSVESTIKFVFAMRFNIRGRTDPELTLRSKITEYFNSSNAARASFPLVLSDVILLEDINEVTELQKHIHIIQKYPMSQLHEYMNPGTFCLVLKLPVTEVPRSPEVQTLSKTLFMGCIAGSMPKKCWWRPRKQGRDRDIFEADTDSGSDGEDEADTDSGSDGEDEEDSDQDDS